MMELDHGLGEMADTIRGTVRRFALDRIEPIAAEIDVAAALAKMMQGDTPFLLQPPVRAPREERAPRERTERPERGDRFDRGDRPKFERAPRGEGEPFSERPRREMPPRGAPE